MITIVNAALGFITTTILGYLLGVIVNKIKNEKQQKEALKCLLQNSLTNIYYVYSEIGEIPDYALKNWFNLMKPYEALDGDDYVHELDIRIRKLKVKPTGVME